MITLDRCCFANLFALFGRDKPNFGTQAGFLLIKVSIVRKVIKVQYSTSDHYSIMDTQVQ